MKKITLSSFIELLGKASYTQKLRPFQNSRKFLRIERKYDDFTLIVVENLNLNNAAELTANPTKIVNSFCQLQGKIEIVDDNDGSTLYFQQIVDLLPPFEVNPQDLTQIFVPQIKFSTIVEQDQIPQGETVQEIKTTGLFPDFSFIGHKLDSVKTAEQDNPNCQGYRVFTLYAEVLGKYLLNIETYLNEVKDGDSKYISSVIFFNDASELLAWDFTYFDYYQEQTISFVSEEDTKALNDLLVKNILNGKKPLKIVPLDEYNSLDVNLHESTGFYPTFSMKNLYEILIELEDFIEPDFEYDPKYVAIGENGAVVLHVQHEHSYLVNEWMECKSINFATVEDFFKWSGLWHDDLLNQGVEILDNEILIQVKKKVFLKLEKDPKYKPRIAEFSL